MVKIVFFDVKPYDKQFLEPLVAELKEPVEVKYLSSKLNKETVSLAKDADIISLFVHDKVEKEMFDHLKCKMIACRSAGFDYVDLNECAVRGIKVATVPSYSPNSIAEFAVGLSINLARKLRMAFERSKNADLSLTSKLLGFEMKGKTVGVFGTGRIGKLVCEIFRGFKMNVIAFDVYEDKEWAAQNGVEYVKTKDEVYARSDIISLHAPLTPENNHMINADAISKMKDGVLIINTGRGGLIDTRALINGIKSRKIGGAALDVYEKENISFDHDWFSVEDGIIQDDDLNRLLGFPNVLVTAHQAYFTREALKEIASVTISNINEFFEKSKEHPDNNFTLKNAPRV
ncbi:unnamed protein product [Brachionus calyciflorus]|uniref:D-lactate dehydrogenase n=1 Tax=Brachionus calyciflorus TaxID=104777 RepID=A0A813T2I5_9BILA|nr:unnamed protein product [Brachionus calyciflorus]